MPIDWSQLSDIPAQQTGSIDWDTLSKPSLATRAAISAQINNDAISQGARNFANQGSSDALGGVSQAALDFLSAAGHNAIKPLHGAAQLVQNAFAPNSATTQADNAAQQKWEQDYQARTPNNAASFIGATAGTLLPFLAGGAATGLQKAGDYVASKLPDAASRFAAGLLPKVVSGGTQGAIAGATMIPVDNGGDFWEQKGKQSLIGTGFGIGLPIVGAAAQGMWNAAAPFINPGKVVGQGLARMGVRPDALEATQFVPGSLPTTAQVAANPQIVAAEKTLANNPAYKGQFDARNISNNDARWSVINDIAQTPEALSAAVQSRKAAMQPMVDGLLNNGNAVPAQPILDQLGTLAKSPLGMRPSISGAARDIAEQIRANLSQDAAGNATIGPAHLDAIRQNVKDYLAQHAPNGIVSSQQQAAFEPVRAAIVDSIEGANPGYRNYLAQYAEHSQPINTMEAAQSIVGNLDNRAANASGAPQLTLGGINTQLGKVGNTQYGIAPDAQRALEGVQSDLQRATVSNSVRSPGSDTSYLLQSPNWLGSLMYGRNYEGSGALSMMGRGLGLLGGTIAGGPAGGLGGYVAGKAVGGAVANAASKKVNDELAKALLNPEIARQLLLAQSRSSGPSPAMQGILSRLPQAGLLMGNVPQPMSFLPTH